MSKDKLLAPYGADFSSDTARIVNFEIPIIQKAIAALPPEIQAELSQHIQHPEVIGLEPSTMDTLQQSGLVSQHTLSPWVNAAVTLTRLEDAKREQWKEVAGPLYSAVIQAALVESHPTPEATMARIMDQLTPNHVEAMNSWGFIDQEGKIKQDVIVAIGADIAKTDPENVNLFEGYTLNDIF